MIRKKTAPYPLYDAPEGLSPAKTQYILNMQLDNKLLGTVMVELAVKGVLSIKNNDKKDYTLTRLVDNEIKLLPEEIALLSGLSLNKANDTYHITNTYDPRVQKTLEAIKKSVKKQCKKRYFTTNRMYTVIGIILSLLTLIPIFINHNPDHIFSLAASFVFTGIIIGAVVSFLKLQQYNLARAYRLLFVHATVLCAYLFFSFKFTENHSGLFSVFNASMLYDMHGPFFIFIIASSLLILNTVFYFLLPQYTKEGMCLLQKILGFRMFLNAAERDRMNFNNPPECTPTLFEKHLPYALSLNVEQRWTEHFSTVIAAGAVARRNYRPRWYHSDRAFDQRSFNSFSSDLTSTISGAATAPSSKGGSSGSSGGGAGGGGGGGW